MHVKVLAAIGLAMLSAAAWGDDPAPNQEPVETGETEIQTTPDKDGMVRPVVRGVAVKWSEPQSRDCAALGGKTLQSILATDQPPPQ